MGSVSTTIYTCDRDGVVSTPTSGGLPAGWSTLNCSTTTAPAAPPVTREGEPPMPPPMPMMNMISLILCDGCTTQFTAFRQPPATV